MRSTSRVQSCDGSTDGSIQPSRVDSRSRQVYQGTRAEPVNLLDPLGNGDLHAKNYSLQWRPDGLVTATPVYDVISTLPYRGLDQHMALNLDGREDSFRTEYFARFGERFGLPRKLVVRRIREMADRLEPVVPAADEIGYDEATTERMIGDIERRLARLRIDGNCNSPRMSSAG